MIFHSSMAHQPINIAVKNSNVSAVICTITRHTALELNHPNHAKNICTQLVSMFTKGLISVNVIPLDLRAPNVTRSVANANVSPTSLGVNVIAAPRDTLVSVPMDVFRASVTQLDPWTIIANKSRVNVAVVRTPTDVGAMSANEASGTIHTVNDAIVMDTRTIVILSLELASIVAISRRDTIAKFANEAIMDSHLPMLSSLKSPADRVPVLASLDQT